MRKVLVFFALIGATIGLLLAAGEFDRRQMLSICIFSTFIYGTLLFGEFRLAFAFSGIAALMGCGLLTVERFTQAASVDVIVFLIGTFLVIGYLEENRFFEHIVGSLMRAAGPRPQLLIASMMFMASVSSCLVGEVAAMLFMAGAMLHMAGRYKLNPVPFVIMLVFACNIGSAMSSVGNPIGVLIALKTGLSFVDFLKWAAPIALVVDVIVYFICRWWFADSFAQFDAAVRNEANAEMKGDVPHGNPEQPKGASQWLCWMVLLLLIGLLLTHGLIEKAMELKEGTMMVAAALAVGGIVMFICRDRARELVERRVDWWTLAFFMMLFASVGTLEDTKVTEKIAESVQGRFHTPGAMIQVVGWSTGWLSAFLDNVLAVATFMPVVHDIRVAAAPQPFSSSIYWMMLFGGTFMGNMTLIGSTANIVAVGLLERRGYGVIRFGYWFKIGFIVSVVAMIVAALLLMVMDWAFGVPMLAPP